MSQELSTTPTPATNQTPALIQEDDSDAKIMAQWKESAQAVATNLDPSTPKGRAMSTRCLATADLKTRSAIGQIVEAVAFFAHPAELVNKETGEVTRKIRVVLVLKDGRTLSTMSAACCRSIGIIAHATEFKAWEPPIRLEFREFPLEGGKSYCDVREMPPDETKRK